MKRIGIAADHGGFELNVQLTTHLNAAAYEVVDFGARVILRRSMYFGNVLLILSQSQSQRRT
jgi:ribose 5-phosphate isomerase RpiB